MTELNVKFEDVEYVGQVSNARLVAEMKLGWVWLANEEIIISQPDRCIVLTKPDS